MSIDLSNLMNMLSSTQLNSSEAGGDAASSGLFFGELLGQLEELGLNTGEDIDPAELMQQFSTFLEQNQGLSNVALNIDAAEDPATELNQLGQQFLQQLKGFASLSTTNPKLENSAEEGVTTFFEDLKESMLQGSEHNKLFLTQHDSNLNQADLSDDLSQDQNGSGFGGQFAFQKLSAATASATTPQPAALEAPVGGDGWQEGLGDRVQWMVKSSVSNAELKLNPANLGPLEISVQVDGDQANITFTSQHASVREAVEAALPKLREMLSSQQLSLNNVEVNQQHSQSSSNEQRRDEQYAWGNSGGSDAGAVDENIESQGGSQTIVSTAGIVSYYA